MHTRYVLSEGDGTTESWITCPPLFSKKAGDNKLEVWDCYQIKALFQEAFLDMLL